MVKDNGFNQLPVKLVYDDIEISEYGMLTFKNPPKYLFKEDIELVMRLAEAFAYLHATRRRITGDG